MIIDLDLFNEVVGAIGIDTAMTVITMFREQTPILLAGAIDDDNDVAIRAQSLHALKGMAQQLGLVPLRQICQSTEQALIDQAADESVRALLTDVRYALEQAQQALIVEANRLQQN